MAKSKLNWDPVFLTKCLSGFALFLGILNTFVQFAIFKFGLSKGWFLLFNMDKEINIPTLYSVLLLLTCAYLARFIGKIQTKISKPIARKWISLQWIFIFLALDEALQIHELLIIPDLEPFLPPLLRVFWIIPYTIFVIFLLGYFKSLMLNLPNRIRYLTLFSGFIYISGALGVEAFGNFLVHTEAIRLNSVIYGLITTMEEAMEMFGLVIFIYTLLHYIVDYQKQKVKINLRITSRRCVDN